LCCMSFFWPLCCMPFFFWPLCCMSFFFWPLCCMSFFDLRILITFWYLDLKTLLKHAKIIHCAYKNIFRKKRYHCNWGILLFFSVVWPTIETNNDTFSAFYTFHYEITSFSREEEPFMKSASFPRLTIFLNIYIYIVRRSIKTLMTTRGRCANRH
jgi:hypothetical protein